MICREHVAGPSIIIIKLFHQSDHLLYPFIDIRDIFNIFPRVRPVYVAVRVEPKEVQEKDDARAAQARIEARIMTGVAEKSVDILEYKGVEGSGVCRGGRAMN